MAITRRAPNTIHLGGEIERLGHMVAGVAITPGMVIEQYDASGTTKWRPAATAAGAASVWVALEQIEMNLGVDVVYAVGDLVQAGNFGAGTSFWGILLSGTVCANAAFLQNDGTGKLIAVVATTAAAGVAKYKSDDNLGTVAADTRVRVEVL